MKIPILVLKILAGVLWVLSIIFADWVIPTLLYSHHGELVWAYILYMVFSVIAVTAYLAIRYKKKQQQKQNRAS